VKTFTVVRALARHRVLDVSLGLHHTSVLVEPGHVYTLGRNFEGQLGNGNTKPQAAPISVKLFQQRPASVRFILWTMLLDVHCSYIVNMMQFDGTERRY
jgi:alpha-tubulin suppressor-like RCC1 family protein